MVDKVPPEMAWLNTEHSVSQYFTNSFIFHEEDLLLFDFQNQKIVDELRKITKLIFTVQLNFG